MKHTEAELHLHLIQSLTVEDLYDLSKDIYQEINWDRFGFLSKYEKQFGIKLNPIEIFESHDPSKIISDLKEICVYNTYQNGSFDEFNIKSFFPYCITGYYYDNDIPEKILDVICERHKKQGIKYIEYRNGFFGTGQEWRDWHARFARYIYSKKTQTFDPRYIVRLGNYEEIKQIIQENPDLEDVIVGVDLSADQLNEKDLQKFLSKYKSSSNDSEPLPLVVHIGESFYNISLDSAIRRVHQAALSGAKRLAHCIVLGIDPLIAINRNKKAHSTETIRSRLEQIRYDLKWANELLDYEIYIDQEALIEERLILEKLDPEKIIKNKYSDSKLLEIKKRQDFVLDQLKQMEVVIEVCPTSNLCIGGIPNKDAHSVHKLLLSKVDLIVCTDDPGIFDITIKDEFNLLNQMGYTKEYLQKRFSDPYDFRLAKK